MYFEILVLILSVVFQFTAAFFALKLIRVNGWLWAWLLISVALVVMAFHRIVTLTRIFSGDISHPPDLTAELVALGIPLLMMAEVLLPSNLLAAILRRIRRLMHPVLV